MKANKALGQHFLTSASAIEKIVEAGNVSSQDLILEIGPGHGVLTRALLARGGRVIAVEKDGGLVSELHTTFHDEITGGALRIVPGDIRDALATIPELRTTPFKIIANIPYYITGLLLRETLSLQVQPSLIVFLVQKEVAERIARSTKESILSLSVKVYGTPRYVGTVKAGSFSPPPKVDSAILAISDVSRKAFSNAEEEEFFFTVLKEGFGSKRKLLLRNLDSLGRARVHTAFETLNIPLSARAEDVSLTTWLELSKLLYRTSVEGSDV